MTIRTILFTSVVVIFVFSCKKDESDSLTKRTFILQDSTLQIEVNVPRELDSVYTWIDDDDTYCGHRRKYRFSNSKQPIFQESGFVDFINPDSSYRITFSHYYHIDCYDSWKVDLGKIVDYYRKGAEMDSVDFKVFAEKKIEINGIPFDVLTFRTTLVPRQRYQSTLIWGFAKVDSIDLKVEYECALKNCDSFIDRMDQSLKSIKITRRD